ncbi:phage repressor protein CI [Cronobacter dublinensis subsp. dublinensis]|uniref:helix-turn-helix domain-containing protein n=1 Tax=Cronobacter dublinensis TaxID=413497 RepID=UPI000CFC90E1|nr:helix-turn-helix domain-containing protein [Cronobacter dublinensis]EGT5712882.1 phage repressor protein CI [Cronobacter dublinensis subsp. dublinensis]EGT5736251.1 phage repressor protein CI [Cronobacter dublinensis subsp. dublinensis]
MSKSDFNASAALERVLSAYGFKQQKELAEKLGIHANNVSSWLARNVIPSNVFVECALDTGADMQWLVNGRLANARLAREPVNLKGKQLYDEIMANGGKAVLRRILDAYGFTMQKELGDLLGISSGTISTWVRRDFFPGDVVVTCALDTGVSLGWLSTGKGQMRDCKEAESSTALTIRKYRLEAGELKDNGRWTPDVSMISANHDEFIFVDGVSASWLVDCSNSKIGNGRWLIGIDGSLDVFDVIRLPGGKVRLSNKFAEFECNLSEITPSGAVIFTLEKHI